LNQEHYRKLISCQSACPAVGLLRLLLEIPTQVYSAAISLRNFLYSKGWLKTHPVSAIVLSVGNITVGGTGKTPLVIWLYNYLTQNYYCAILTRGYKTTQNSKLKTQNYTDELAIFTQNCPKAKVIVNPNRVAGAIHAAGVLGAKVLIMDDGFQYRRLARNLDIVTIDATLPFGYDKLLPAGLLREPVSALKRTDAVVITRCDQVADIELHRLEEKLRSVNPHMVIAKSIHAPLCAKSHDNKDIAIQQLEGKKIFAFCGIGNPDAFSNTIQHLGSNLVGLKVYNDHYHYTNSDIADISNQAGHSNADLILTTQKDWSKILQLTKVKEDIPFAYLAIKLKFLAGEDKLIQLIEDALAGKIHKK
jgi:tetraacyldisaccharide 4'-kinase